MVKFVKLPNCIFLDKFLFNHVKELIFSGSPLCYVEFSNLRQIDSEMM